MSQMGKIEFYNTAVANLGFLSTVRLEMEKRLSRSRPMQLTSRMLDFPVAARRNTSDLSVFHQIFTLREYRCLDGINIEGLIVDLGANVGYSSAYFLSRFKGCPVVAIEPDPANCAMLQQNLAPYRTRLTAIQAAIWPGADRVSLHKPRDGEEWGITATPSNEGTVETITIPEIMRVVGCGRISLLKVDIEGAEKQLFEADTSWLESVDNIVIELHGDECENAFFAKIDRSRFTISKCDELTVCLS